MKVSLFIAGLTIICVLIVSAALALKSWQLKSVAPPLYTQINTPSVPVASTSALIVPDDWKSYSSPKFEYQLKIPQQSRLTEFNFYYTQPSLAGGVNIELLGQDKTVHTVIVSVWKNLSIEVTDLVTFDKWCKKLQPQLTDLQKCHYDNLQPTQLNSYPAFIATDQKNNAQETIYYLPHKNYIYQIDQLVPMTDKDSTISATVLSSLKFTP